MKQLLIITLLFFAISCTKERDYQPEATCDFVFDKYYQWYPVTPTDTTYWLRMAKDTLMPPPPQQLPPGTFYVLQVSKVTYDTIGLPRKTRYCY